MTKDPTYSHKGANIYRKEGESSINVLFIWFVHLKQANRPINTHKVESENATFLI